MALPRPIAPPPTTGLPHPVAPPRTTRVGARRAARLPRPVALLLSTVAVLGALLTPVRAEAASLVSNPASLVNPLLGTTNAANDFPGADVPFGMVQWSPDTNPRPYGGGYAYTSSTITGF